jgi:hypothetical protein
MFYWLKFMSPTTNGPRLLHVGGSGADSQDEWWVGVRERFDSGWADAQGGGFYLNFHNVAKDVGNTGSGGIGWGFGSGVSALALAYGGSNPAVPSRHRLHLEYAGLPGYEVALPDPGLGKWFSLVIHVVFGRTDGTSKRPGSIQVWYDGNDSPAVDLRNINILQRATNPANGQTYTQEYVDAWQGGPYRGRSCGTTVASTSQTVATRFGRTLPEMLADTNITLNQKESYGSVHIAGQPDYGNSTATLMSTSQTTNDFALPPSPASQAGSTAALTSQNRLGTG